MGVGRRKMGRSSSGLCVVSHALGARPERVLATDPGAVGAGPFFAASPNSPVTLGEAGLRDPPRQRRLARTSARTPEWPRRPTQSTRIRSASFKRTSPGDDPPRTVSSRSSGVGESTVEGALPLSLVARAGGGNPGEETFSRVIAHVVGRGRSEGSSRSRSSRCALSCASSARRSASFDETDFEATIRRTHAISPAR